MLYAAAASAGAALHMPEHAASPRRRGAQRGRSRGLPCPGVAGSPHGCRSLPPPHLLLTTPCSLGLLLTGLVFREVRDMVRRRRKLREQVCREGQGGGLPARCRGVGAAAAGRGRVQLAPGTPGTPLTAWQNPSPSPVPPNKTIRRPQCATRGPTAAAARGGSRWETRTRQTPSRSCRPASPPTARVSGRRRCRGAWGRRGCLLRESACCHRRPAGLLASERSSCAQPLPCLRSANH